jgi:LysR family transcriptional regulator, regulator for metE and metH
MEIRHLRLVKAIVEEGSITKAIDKLHLTQSALSHQLKEAESQLGTEIFTRHNKKLKLTKAGDKLYQIANEILEKLFETEKEIKQMVFGEVGEIRITTECYTSYNWLPAVLKQFQLLYPNVDLVIVPEATNDPLAKLLSNDLDVAIVCEVLKDERIKYFELFQDEMLIVVPENHAMANKKFVVPEDFVNENLFIHSLPYESVSIIKNFLKPANIEPRKITVLPHTEATIEFVKAEMGVKSMDKWALRPYLKGQPIKAVKIGKHGLKRNHSIAIQSHRACPEYLMRFIEFLQAEINYQWEI